MPIPWFIWNGESSFNHSLWISKLPPIKRAKERMQEVHIPGRAGMLTLLEGDDIYDPYTRECVVTTTNDRDMQDIMNWLRGNGELIVSTEPDHIYDAQISSEVVFNRISNNLQQATIPFYCQPYKRMRYPVSLAFADCGNNPGDVKSKPKLTVTKTGALTIQIGETSMSFEHLPGKVVIDCDAEIITTEAKAYDSSAYYYVGDYCTNAGGIYRFLTEGIGTNTQWEYVRDIDDPEAYDPTAYYYIGDYCTYQSKVYRFITEGIGSNTQWEYVRDAGTFTYIWPGAWTGEYLRIPTGKSHVSLSATATVTVEPNWRWV